MSQKSLGTAADLQSLFAVMDSCFFSRSCCFFGFHVISHSGGDDNSV